MAPPSWAYQVDNFDPAPDEELVCSVCRSIFCDPVQSPCNHVYCRACLFKWLENNRNCPICRKRTTRSSVQDVVPLIKNMIMKLTLRCRNWDNNCREKFTLEACETHIRICPYEIIQCKNKPCVKMFLRKDIRDHELKTCPHRTIRCLKCYLRIPPTEESHDCIAALKRKLKAQDEDLKKKNKKIKELQKELKRLEDAQQAVSSDGSSLGSVSAADILIDLEDMPSISTASSASDDSSVYESDGYETRWFDFLEDSRSDSTIDIILGNDRSNEDSSEFPFVIEPSFVEADASESLNEEPVVRRPAKRRHPMQILDTSDEDDNNNRDSELPSLPSPKRNWNVFRRNNETSQEASRTNEQASSDCATAGPSHASSYEAAAAEASRNKPGHSRVSMARAHYPFHVLGLTGPRGPPCSAGPSNAAEELKSSRGKGSGSGTAKLSKSQPVLRHRTRNRDDGHTSTTHVRPNPMFERTLAMLEQYNLESDDEWRPTRRERVEDDSSDSDAEEGNDFLEDNILTSEEASSYCDSDDSTSSFETPPQTDWFARLFDSPGDNDPDWTPHYVRDIEEEID